MAGLVDYCCQSINKQQTVGSAQDGAQAQADCSLQLLKQVVFGEGARVPE